jgi:hypothetical protein
MNPVAYADGNLIFQHHKKFCACFRESRNQRSLFSSIFFPRSGKQSINQNRYLPLGKVIYISSKYGPPSEGKKPREEGAGGE